MAIERYCDAIWNDHILSIAMQYIPQDIVKIENIARKIY